jgi:hypothetical protein
MKRLFPLQSDGNTTLAASDIGESQTLVASAVAEQCSGRTSEPSGIAVLRGSTSKPFGIAKSRSVNAAGPSDRITRQAPIPYRLVEPTVTAVDVGLGPYQQIGLLASTCNGAVGRCRS